MLVRSFRRALPPSPRGCGTKSPGTHRGQGCTEPDAGGSAHGRAAHERSTAAVVAGPPGGLFPSSDRRRQDVPGRTRNYWRGTPRSMCAGSFTGHTWSTCSSRSPTVTPPSWTSSDRRRGSVAFRSGPGCFERGFSEITGLHMDDHGVLTKSVSDETFTENGFGHCSGDARQQHQRARPELSAVRASSG